MNIHPNDKEHRPQCWQPRRPAFNRFATTLGAAAVLGLLFAPLRSDAALLAYEGFNYQAGSGNLPGQSGGFGWGGTWRTVNNGASSVQSPSLAADVNAPAGYDSLSTGNTVFSPNNSRSGRALDTSVGGSFGLKGFIDGNGNIGTAGKTVYISFMQQPNGVSSYYEFEFHRGDLGDPGRVAGIGNDSGGNTSVYLRVPAAGQTAIGAGSTAVNFYVVRIDFQGGNDTISVYQNPTSVTEPAAATLTLANAGDLSFSGLSFGCFNNGRTVMHDEIRVGETWADVVSPSGVQSAGIWDGGGANNNWSTAGNWDNDVVPVFASGLTFAGSTRLVNNNDLTAVSANSITFDAGAGAFTLGGNSLGLNGNIRFNGEPAAPITQTIALPLAPSGNFIVETRTNGNITIVGDITGPNAELTKSGVGNSGILTLAGNNTLKGMVVNNGTNRITGTTTINGIGGSSFFFLADANVNRDATLIIENGATLNVSGGFQDAAVLGRDGGVAKVIQNGGTFSFNINDGAHEFLFVGASGNPNTRAAYNMNGGLLDMNGRTLGIALGANTVITGAVNQVGGTIDNVGNLLFSPFFTQGRGFYNLTGGRINIGALGITAFPGSTYEINLGGGTVGAVTSWASTLNMNLTGSNGPVTFRPEGNNIQLTGILSGSGGLTVAGPGTLQLGGANTYTGDTTVSAGSTLQLDTTGSSFGAFRLVDGALLNLNFSGTYVVGSLYVNGVAKPVGTYNAANLPGLILGPGELQVSSGISTGLWTGGGANNNWSTAGNWDNNAVPVFPHAVTFAGNTRLVNNNDLSAITLSGLTFDAAAGAFTLNGNDVTLSGTLGFSGPPAAPVTQTLNFGMTFTGDQTINLPANANLTLGGSLISANGLVKTGPGSLTLGGANDTFSTFILNGGTNFVTGNVTVSGTAGNRFYIGDIGSSASLVIQPGGAFYVTGFFADAGVLGRDSGSGSIVQNGGLFSFNPANQSYLFVGASSNPSTRGEYIMNGGVADLNNYTLGVALSANASTVITGLVSQTAGTFNNVGQLNLGVLFKNPGHGIYKMTGGTINIGLNGIQSDSGSYEIFLGGGTVGAYASWSSPLNMTLTGVNGPVTFDPAGNTITLSGALSGPGGLKLNGAGVLEVSGLNTYVGDTIVQQGTLQINTPGSSPSAVRIANGAMLNLNFAGELSVPGFYTNGVSLAVGTYTAANLPGFITGTGSVRVAGLAFTVQPLDQVLYLNKDSFVSLTSAVVGGTATFQWYKDDTIVPGATASSLTISPLQVTNAGNYYVVATGASGSVTSDVATVTVYAINNNLFVYEGFDYAPGSVDGATQAGGFGWDGPWQQVNGNGVIIAAGSLAGGGNVPSGFDSRTGGNSIEVPSNAQTRSGRLFNCSSTGELFKQGFINANGNIGADGKTIYLSFLQQPDRTSGFYEMEFHRGNLGDPGRIGGIGNDAAGDNVNLRAPNDIRDRSLGAGTTAVNYYVVRIDFKPGNDDVFVYRNPISSTEPAVPTLVVSNVTDLSFNGVSVAAYNGPDVKHDEIRLGATWADAVGLAVSNLLTPIKTATGFKLRFAVTPGYSYRLQRAAQVGGPWADVTTIVGPANGYAEYEDAGALSGQAFYRTVTP